MLDLLRGRTDTTDRLIAVATEAAAESALADASLVLQAGRYYSAALAGDTATCAFGAERAEGFALAEGVTAVLAEAAFLWTCAGDVPRTAALLNTLGDLDDLPRDVNFLLILQCVLDAALASVTRRSSERCPSPDTLRGTGSDQLRRRDAPRRHRRHARPSRRLPR